MRAAIPMYSALVAPRFGFAQEFLVATIEDGVVAEQHLVVLPGDGWQERLRALRDHRVSVILCGGFNRRFEPLAESHGIRVVCGCVGNAELVAQRYAERGEEALAGLGDRAAPLIWEREIKDKKNEQGGQVPPKRR